MSERPNILWICLDQLRWDWLGCMGHPLVRTPHVDRLAREGTLCVNGFCQAPVCMPSRASFLSGCYPRTIGLRQNGQDLPEHAHARMMPARLGALGYATACFGKLHLHAVDRTVALTRRGEDLDMSKRRHDREPHLERFYQVARWDHNGHASDAGSDYRAWLQARGADPDSECEPLSECRFVLRGHPSETHCSSWTAESACDWLEQQRSGKQPWLCSVNFIDPHHPFDPPPEWLDRWSERLEHLPVPRFGADSLASAPPLLREYNRRAYNEPWFDLDWTHMSAGQHRVMQAAYGAMIEHVDAQMGRILATLDAIGQRDNTIVVFHNDHGEFLGDHGTYYKGPFLYDCCIRTPLIWRWPNRIAAGVRRSALVELVDVAPTLMALCGMREQCLGMQGTDLSALLRDEAHPDSHKAAVYAEYLHDSLPGHADGTVLSAMYRTTTHKLIHWAGKQYGELYALGVDPEECVNEWKNPALGEVRSQMHEAMCGHLVGMVDPLPPRTGMY